MSFKCGKCGCSECTMPLVRPHIYDGGSVYRLVAMSFSKKINVIFNKKRTAGSGRGRDTRLFWWSGIPRWGTKNESIAQNRNGQMSIRIFFKQMKVLMARFWVKKKTSRPKGKHHHQAICPRNRGAGKFGGGATVERLQGQSW